MTTRLSQAEAGRAVRDKASFWQESNTQVAIVRYLRAALSASYRVISIPNGRFKADPATIGRLKREGLTPGAPDLLILRNDGWFGSMEVKANKGRLSPEQADWADWQAGAGASYAVVRSLDEAQDVARAWGILRVRAA